MSAPTEQEEKLQSIYGEIEALFKKVDKTKDDKKLTALLRDVTNKLKDAKALIKEFEREARTDGMPPKELAERKRMLVNTLNDFIATKKAHSDNLNGRGQLLDGHDGGGDIEGGMDGMSMQQLMDRGKKEIQETNNALDRTEKLVEDTIQIGQTTAATLNDQTTQMNKIVDDLNEMEFTMKKASKVIRDISRGLLTDKCIGALLVLVICGVIAIVILKVINPSKAAQAAISNAVNATANAASNVSVTGRRLLGRRVPFVQLYDPLDPAGAL